MIDNVTDFYKKYQESFDKVMSKSDALPKGFQKGKIFRIQVADGYTYYEITKVNKNTVWIEWRKDLSLDGYQDRILGVGGKIEKNRINHIILFQDKMTEIHSRNKGE
jgi:hypothetical protein